MFFLGRKDTSPVIFLSFKHFHNTKTRQINLQYYNYFLHELNQKSRRVKRNIFPHTRTENLLIINPLITKESNLFPTDNLVLTLSCELIFPSP